MNSVPLVALQASDRCASGLGAPTTTNKLPERSLLALQASERFDTVVGASVSQFGSSLFTLPFPPGRLLYHEQEERHFFLNLLFNLHAKSIWQEVL